MNKNTIIVSLLVGIAGLAAVCGHLYVQQRRQARAAEEKFLAAEKAAQQAAAARKAEAVEAPLDLSAGGPRIPQAAPAPAAPAPAVPPAAGNKPSLMAGLAEMLKSPEMKNMLRQQQKFALDMQYGSLFKYLNLPPEQLEGLKELLIERQMAMMEAGLDLMKPGASAADRKEQALRAKELTEQHNQKIAQLLGEEQYGVFKQYEDTQPERAQIQMFKSGLTGVDGVTEQQEHDLIRAMYEERQSMTKDGGFPDQSNPDPATFTAQGMEKALDQLGKLQDRYAVRAADVLSPAQLEQFKRHQTQQRAMQQMGIKMAAQMFAPQEGNAAPATAPQPSER
jgi:hypothetical protein